jgi:hypothetical protein
MRREDVRRHESSRRRILVAAWALASGIVIVGASGCAREAPASGWGGTVDTLASGQIVVYNPAGSVWAPGSGWTVREDVRVGTLEGTGPDMFGEITDFEVDAYGRFWLFEGQAQDLRVFDASGRFVRTVGRQGEGPGEFNRVIGMDWGPDGHLWLADPSNNRLSVVDTTGAFVASHPTIGGVVVQPWPGGFDASGHFYTYGIDTAQEDGFGLVMVRYGRDLQPVDSVAPPEFPGERETFELRKEDNWWITGVPFSPRLEWRLARDGTYWAGLTSEYRIFQLSWEGDTLRSVRREYEALPVTAGDLEAAREDLKWFIEAGGKPDWSRIPQVKPAFEDFILDDESNLWVQLVTEGDEEGRRFDVFDPEGRYLGEVTTPFGVEFYPPPIIRAGYLYAVTEDELEVPFAVRAAIRDTGARR